jgi:flagellum-specific peptidoglycan hydrolase FlgJ
VRSVRKPWWQQATALVTVSTGGVITGLNFIPGAATTMTSPTSVPLHLLALEQAGQPGTLGALAAGGDSAASATSDAQLRAAIVNVAGYYLRLASGRSPAQMEALIWDDTSSDGTDHGESCAAFASLTLELAAQAVGQQSWVSGGSSYPYPLPEWADVRVDTNPASPRVTSIVADAQAHGRWHPLGDGYHPQPGDWVLFDGHVEVLTSYSNGMLDTIGADSLPGLTVNAHSFRGELAEQGVTGFVNNGQLKAAPGTTTGTTGHGGTSGATAGAAPAGGTARGGTARGGTAAGGTSKGGTGRGGKSRPAGAAAVPGVPASGALGAFTGGNPAGTAAAAGSATRATGGPFAAGGVAPAGHATVPGLPGGTLVIEPMVGRLDIGAAASAPAAGASAPTSSPAATPPATPAAAPASAPPAASSQAGRTYATPGTRDQQAFISLVAPGALAAQQRFGVPAAVTIAQAIEESAWGRSSLAAQYHNLFGIKGTGPAGTVSLPTTEYSGGHWVTVDAQFRVYHNDAESIADHAELLATSGYYTRAMADRAVPDAFANNLTGVYATDPQYGSNLIALMKLYNLYRFNGSATAAQPSAPAAPTTAAGQPAVTPPASTPASPAASPAATPPVAGPQAPGQHATADPVSATGTTPGGYGSASAQVPGVAAPTLAPAHPTVTTSPTAAPGAAPGSAGGGPGIPGLFSPGTFSTAAPGTTRTAGVPGALTRGSARIPGVGTGPLVTTAAVRYTEPLPHAVTTAFFVSAKAPLARGEHLYRDVASCTGIGWQLLAAVDWMQCKADPRYSPVHGEKLGALNADGTAYSTKSSALAQCATDLIELAAVVYGIDLTARRRQSVRSLAAAFAAFRWGGILRKHGISAMEFPFSVAGLTPQHQKMHWPPVGSPEVPDRPGGRFRDPFGAVPVVLSLGYPATV